MNTVSGSANTASLSNSAAIMPTSLINTLGNILQGCVNSTGGLATPGATSGCPGLFQNTIIATTTGSGTTTITPSNTLQATINMAHAPAQNVSTLLGIAPAAAAFSPGVTNPADLSMAIYYPSGTGATTNIGASCSGFSASPNGLCDPLLLDIDYVDNVFLDNGGMIFSGYASADNIISFSSTGANRFATALSTTDHPLSGVAADNLGNVFYGGQANARILEIVGASGASQSFTSISYSSQNLGYGSPVPTPASLNIASSNNLYVSTQYASPVTSNTGYSVAEFSYGNYGSPVSILTNYYINANPSQVAIDAPGNIWFTKASSFALTPAVLPGGTTRTTSIDPFITTGPGESNQSGIAVDSSGNAWWNTGTAILKATPMSSGGTLTSATSVLAVTLSSSGMSKTSMSGNDLLVATDSRNNAVILLPTAATTLTPVLLHPCIPGIATTCPAVSSTTATLSGAKYAQADSTGTLWVINATSAAQIIGTATPTWPLAHQTPGVMP